MILKPRIVLTREDGVTWKELFSGKMLVNVLRVVHIIKHLSWLQVRRRETQSLSRDCSFNCCAIRGTIYPQFISCIPTVLEHFGTVWSLHESGEAWESFQWASPHSTPSSFPVYTSNISTPEKKTPLQSHFVLSPSQDHSRSVILEDEKSRPAVKT